MSLDFHMSDKEKEVNMFYLPYGFKTKIIKKTDHCLDFSLDYNNIIHLCML